MKTVSVAGEGFRPYEVRIGRGLLADAGAAIAPLLNRRRVTVVADAEVWRLHGPALTAGLAAGGVDSAVLEVAPGEASKSFAELERLCAAFAERAVDRKDLVLAFGGGVIGDLAGFAAAVWMRGVDFVQIPTTLLAQVDSSVGGKTAIDTPHGKNLVGAFWQPRLVLADLALLDTLPEREMRAGYAEVIKYGLLGDAAFFARLETEGGRVLARDSEGLEAAVARAVQMKAEIVAEDAREAGRRALLNLGHTFGHALEAETGFGEALLHGEAVGLGMALAFRFSAAQGLCPPADAARAEAAIAAAGLPVRLTDLDRPLSAERLVAHMGADKKAEGGVLVFVLVRGIGRAFVAKGVDPRAVFDFLVSEGARP